MDERRTFLPPFGAVRAGWSRVVRRGVARPREPRGATRAETGSGDQHGTAGRSMLVDPRCVACRGPRLPGHDGRLETMTGKKVSTWRNRVGVVVNRLILDYFLTRHEAGTLVYVVDSFAFYSGSGTKIG